MLRPISFPIVHQSLVQTGNRPVIQLPQADRVTFSGNAKSTLSEEQTTLMKAMAKVNNVQLTPKNTPTNPQELQKFFFEQAQAMFDAGVKATYDQIDAEEKSDPETTIIDSIASYSQEDVDAFMFSLGKALTGKSKYVHPETLGKWLGLSKDETRDKLYEAHSTACDKLIESLK